MKEGEIVVCVRTEGVEHALTKGRSYTVEGTKGISGISRKETYIVIENDNGNKIEYLKERFKTLEEIREEKLKELGL